MPGTPSESPWEFDPPLGRLQAGPWSAEVDVARPQLGWHRLAWNAALLEGQLLGLAPDPQHRWPSPLADAYRRGDDLVASYWPTDPWPYAAEIYWSADATPPDATLAAAALLVSIQTDLLDALPRLALETRLPAEEVLQISVNDRDQPQVTELHEGRQRIAPHGMMCCLVRRLPGSALSVAEVMLTRDFREVIVAHQPGDTTSTRWQLFAEFLEKGVIRRARCHVAFLPREQDIGLATAVCRAFERRPLPLTT